MSAATRTARMLRTTIEVGDRVRCRCPETWGMPCSDAAPDARCRGRVAAVLNGGYALNFTPNGLYAGLHKDNTELDPDVEEG